MFWSNCWYTIRLFLIRKLVGSDLKVVSNVTITSDIVDYNRGIDVLHNTHIKQVSSKQSFVLDPTTTHRVW